MNQSSTKIDFLNSAINDTQETIRFIDTKLGVAITLVGGLLAVVLSMTEKIITYCGYYDFAFWLFLAAFILLMILNIITIIRIIAPVSDPKKNVNLGNVVLPDLKFYLPKNKYHSKFYCLYNSEKHILDEPFETYLNSITAADENVIISVLACEKFKLNYIRNVKSDRLGLLTKFLVILTIIFISMFIVFSIETHKASEKAAASAKKIEAIKTRPQNAQNPTRLKADSTNTVLKKVKEVPSVGVRRKSNSTK